MHNVEFSKRRKLEAVNSRVVRNHTPSNALPMHNDEFTTRRKLDPDDVNSRAARFLISSNVPLEIVEYRSFQALVTGEERRKLMKTTDAAKATIIQMFEEFQSSLKAKLSGVPAVAVTADAWSSYNKSYLGITASWYKYESLKRNTAILALRRTTENLTQNEIREQLKAVFEEYGIRDRVKSITTDNGSNFIKCMIIHGEQPQDPEEILDYKFEIEVIEIDDLVNSDSTVSGVLPRHIRCAVHRLNLVAQSFETKLDRQSEFWKNYDQLSRKCRDLWNAQGESPEASDALRKLCGSLFIVPTDIRWKSLLDAYKDILKKAKHLNEMNEVLNILLKINDDDLQLLSSFVKIMNKIALAIDTLQGDNTPYGMLYTVIEHVKHKLVVYSREYNNHSILVLISLLQKEMNTRFSDISECDELAAVVAPMCLEKDSGLKTLAVANFNRLLEKCLVSRGINENLPDSWEFRLFSPKSMFGECLDTEETNENLPDSWELELFSPKSSQHDCRLIEFYSKNRTQRDLHNFECLKRLFIDYNTPLATGASIERMFSQAKRVLIFDKKRLGDDMFEILTVLRCGVKTSSTL